MALREGLSLALSYGLQVAFAKIDAINVVNEVKCCHFDFIYAVIVKNVVELLALVKGGICHHISRQSNMVWVRLVLVEDGNTLYDYLKANVA